MQSLRRLTSLAFAVVLAAACGSEPIGAVVGDGSVQITPKGGDAAVVEGGVTPFGDGANAVAVDGAATINVAVGASMDGNSSMSDRPRAGTMNVTLSDGAQLRRRAGTVFDLRNGDLEIVTGPVSRRIVVFHGKVFLEIHDTSDANSGGARLRATTAGETMTVHVEEGEVLLHAPVSRPGDLHYATLLAGEHATAKAGEKPEKNAEPDAE